MKTEIRPFEESTLSDAKKVTGDMFVLKVGAILDKMLDNPLRKTLGCVAAGEVAYQDDAPFAFQGAILRRLFIGQREICGVVGSTLASRPETSPVLLMKLMKSTIKPRGGSELFFGNTSNVTSMKMNRMLGVLGRGPASCEVSRFVPIVWPRFAKWLLPSPRCHVIESFYPELFDSFWHEYISANAGLVSSRTAEELEWMFGDGLRDGSVVVLGSFGKDHKLDGYIILRISQNRRKWMVHDWIAINNDKVVLKDLLKSAVRYLRKNKAGLILEAIGYPDFVQDVIAEVLYFKRKMPNNSFIWEFSDKKSSVPVGSWFFGAYDGDRAMG